MKEAISTFSNDFDAVRAAHPELAFALYAYDPGGPVTLEIITPDEKHFLFTGATAESALLQAFELPEQPTNIFD